MDMGQVIALIKSFTRGLKTEMNSKMLTNDIRAALVLLAEKAAYSDNTGQTVYNTLVGALYTEWPVTNTLTHCSSSNNAQNVTKNGSYSATITADENYTLAGATVLITMGGVDITSTAYSSGTISIASVTGPLVISITAAAVQSGYVTDGLVAYWDGIDNTGSGHSSSATTWADLVGSYDLTENTVGGTWDTDGIVFDGTAFNGFYRDNLWTYFENATIEIVAIPDADSTTMGIATFDRKAESSSGSLFDVRRFSIYSDNTIGFVGVGGKTYDNISGNTASDIRKLVATYNGFAVVKCFANNQQLSLSSKSHSFTFAGDQQMRVGAHQMSGSNSYPFNGKICAIRVYNRVLTDEEITQNFNYDNARFNLEVS